MVYTAEKALADHAAKIPEDVKKLIQDAVQAVKTKRETGDLEGIKSASQTLSTEMQKIGQYVTEEKKEDKPPEAPPTPESNVTDV
jgi:molecular chaperone DnaK